VGSGTLNGVTLDGTLDMSAATATVFVTNGLTLDTDLYVSGENADLQISDGSTVAVGPLVKNATIHLSGDYSTLYNASNNLMPVGPGITISGETSNSVIVGPIDNLGTIEQNGPGDLAVDYGLVNDGTIVSSRGGAVSAQSDYEGFIGPALINDADGTIMASDGGSLALYDNWTNGGRISVDASSAVSLGSPVTDSNYSSAASYIWTNTGTLAIAPGATVNLGDYFTTDDVENHFQQLGVNLDLSKYTVNLIGTIDNSAADNPITGGTLALNNSTGPLYLSAGVINGGTIATNGRNDLIATDANYSYDYSNDIPVGGGTLIGVTLDGTLDMQSIPAATATVSGGLTLNGAIALTGAGAALDFGVYDTTPETIGGTGVVLFGFHNADSLQNTSTGTLTFGPSIAIVGGLNSAIDSPNAPVVNQGTIVQDTPGGVLAVASPDPFSNAGNVMVGRGGTVSTGTALYIQSGGTTTVDGILQAATINLNGGSLNGTGMMQGNVVNAALIVPGDPFGTLIVQGNYTQTATGVLLIQIAGTSQHGQLAITGSATLAGTLEVSLLGNYIPVAGTNFQILTFADYSGSFTTELGLGLPHHRSLQPEWGSDDLTLTTSS
jgi:hypothetical protein